MTAPDPLPKACAQASITIDTTVEEKLRQELYWMSDAWIRSYARRSRVEAAWSIYQRMIRAPPRTRPREGRQA